MTNAEHLAVSIHLCLVKHYKPPGQYEGSKTKVKYQLSSVNVNGGDNDT